MEAGDSAAGDGDEHEGPDRGSLGVHVGEVGKDLGDAAVDDGAESNADSHDDQADAEQGVNFADDLVNGDEGRDEVVDQDDREPEGGLEDDTALDAAVLEQGDKQAGGADGEDGADHDQQDDGEDAHDVLHRAAEVDAGDLGDGGAVVALGQHAGKVVMNSAGENSTEGDPQENHRSPHGAGQSAEDGAEARDIQKLNHEQLPLGQYDIVDTVVNGDSGSLAVVRIEDAVYELAIEEIAADKDCKTCEKAYHCFFLLTEVNDSGYSQNVHIPCAYISTMLQKNQVLNAILFSDIITKTIIGEKQALSGQSDKN